MFFFAVRPAFPMAWGTSLALPNPYPISPLPFPTTTRAEKENRRPPFTTFATRLIETTRSSKSFETCSATDPPKISIRLHLQHRPAPLRNHDKDNHFDQKQRY